MNIWQYADLLEKKLLANNLFFGHGVDNAFDEAVWLIMSGANIKEEALNQKLNLSEKQMLAIDVLANKRIKTRRPLSYLLNKAWFAGHEFYIDERAIIPRSYIGEWIPERFKPWLVNEKVDMILDLCTGSGCIGVALAMAFPESKVDATDISSDALDVAKINAKKFLMSHKMRFFQGDLFNALPTVIAYDLIACNPPYVNDVIMNSLPTEYEFEPQLALAGGKDGLFFIRKILRKARHYLNSKGVIFIEVGSAAESVEQAWPTVPFTWLTSFSGDSPILLITAEQLDTYKKHFDYLEA